VRRVLLVLPYAMSARVMLRTPVLRHLAARPDLAVTVVSRDAEDAGLLAAAGGTFTWQPLYRPAALRKPLAEPGAAVHAAAFALGFYLHLMLVFRFNAQAGFVGFRNRLRQSPRLRRLALKEGLPISRWLGRPLPESKRLYRLAHRLYFEAWQRQPAVETLFEESRPELVVLAHQQTPFVVPYALAAVARGVPLLGINGSWDQPTTKGPLVPGIGRMLVQSRRVRDELERFHGVDPARVEIVGWPQMDLYADPATFLDRAAFLARLGLPPGRRYVLVGAYAERLGSHEPAMCRALAERVRAGAFGAEVTLYLRCHPLDGGWRDRFGALHAPPDVIVEPPQIGALDHLANLLRHAGVVISSAGTIGLDAAALDRPAIGVAFDDERLPYYDRASRMYEMEHYAAVVATGGLRLARSQAELETAIRAYLDDDRIDAEGRAALRREHLEPLDGGASARLVAAIAQAARAAA
jgi:hypothetical protein